MGTQETTKINFNYAPGTTLKQMIAMEVAGSIWSNRLQDNVDLHMFVKMTNDLPENVVGGALPAIQAKTKLEDFERKLKKDITSDEDDIAVKNLPTDGKEALIKIDKFEAKQAEEMNITTANAKAVDLYYEDYDKKFLDGVIIMNNFDDEEFSWDYDFVDSNVGIDRVDFLSVALHEIGHNLGFVSGLDNSDFLLQLNNFQDTRRDTLTNIKNLDELFLQDYVSLFSEIESYTGKNYQNIIEQIQEDPKNADEYYQELLNDLKLISRKKKNYYQELLENIGKEAYDAKKSYEDLLYVINEDTKKYHEELIKNESLMTPLDLFRYSSNSLSFDNRHKYLDFSVGADSFFSIDGTVENSIAPFSTGSDLALGGDGYQASHWKQSDNPLGIMDPVINLGETREVSHIDLQIMDVIGWDLQEVGEISLAEAEIAAKQKLADLIGVDVEWLEANPQQSARLLTSFVDEDETGVDDRVEEMIEKSEVYEVYEWGVRRSRSGSFWQSMGEYISPQTINLETKEDIQSSPGFIDLREDTNIVDVEFTLMADSDFENQIVLYKVDDLQGNIQQGENIISPSIDSDYISAVLDNRVTLSQELKVIDDRTTVFSDRLNGGSIYSSMLIVDGTLDELLDKDPSNDPQVYFSSPGANSDRLNHVKQLDDNVFGYEDLANGGDNDFNDLVMEYSF